MRQMNNGYMKRLSLTGSGKWPGLLCLFLASVALYALILRAFVLPHYSGGTDFYTEWKAAQEFFLLNRDPYSQQVMHDIQIGIYGKVASAGQDPYVFAYPLYFSFLIFPLTWLPFLDALAIWLAFLQIGVGVVFFLLLSHYELGQRPFTRGLYFLWGLVLLPTIAGFWLAQPSVLIFILFGCAWLALYHQRDWLAGICLGLLIAKPHVIALPLALLLIYALRQRRLKIILGFGGVVLGLVGGSLLVFPTWPISFLANVQQYSSYNSLLFNDGPALRLFTALTGPLNIPLFIAASLLIVLSMLWTWWQALKGDWNMLERALVITTLAQASLFSAQHIPNQMFLIIPGFYLLANLTKLRNWRSSLFFYTSTLGMFLLPWLIRIVIPSRFAGSPWIITPIPLALALLYLALFSTGVIDGGHHSKRQVISQRV